MQDWMKLALLLAVIFAIVQISRCRSDGFMSVTPNVTTATPGPSRGTPLVDASGLPLTDATAGFPMPNGCVQPQSIDTSLLPAACKSGDSEYAEFAPSPDALKQVSFLEPGKFIGQDSTQGALKNSNYQLRADPAIPDCGNAWGGVYKSTIQPDPWRKSLADCSTTAPH